MIYSYVDGVNAYVKAARSHPALLPGDYAAAVPDLLPTNWTVADVVVDRRSDRRHLRPRRRRRGRQRRAAEVPAASSSARPPGARPTTSSSARTTRPRRRRSWTSRSRTRFRARSIRRPRHCPTRRQLSGGPVNTDPNCNLQKPNLDGAVDHRRAEQHAQAHEQRAWSSTPITAPTGTRSQCSGRRSRTTTRRSCPQLDLHSPDYDAEGASFPGTGIVELGRGQDFAWSATSAGSDLIDQRLEKVCNPTAELRRRRARTTCTTASAPPMIKETFREVALPKPGGVGAPGDPDAQHLPDPARRRAGLDDVRRQAGRGRQPALDVQPRRRLGGRLHRLGTAGIHARRHELDGAAPTRSCTRSTGSTSTTATPVTSSAASTRSVRRTSIRRCRRGGPASRSGRAS